MLLHEVFQDAKGLLSEADLPVPRAKVRATGKLLSWVGNPREVNAGLLTRVFGSYQKQVHSLLHELLHILVYRYPPAPAVRACFGTPREWEAPQQKLRMLGKNAAYVTAYASTHPEEDFVETAAFLLQEEEPVVSNAQVWEKAQAVNTWFEAMRLRRRR